MAENLKNKSCAQLSEELASAAPVPGGGSAAAYLGALSAALCSMAAVLSGRRAELPAVGEELRQTAARAEVLRRRMLELMDADAGAFTPLARAYALPKDAPGREETLRELSLQAAAAPLEMLRLCGDVVGLLEQLLHSAGSLLLSDVGCAASVCRAAVDCAAMNVWVNTRLFRDDARAQAYEREALALHAELLSRADAVAQAVREILVN